MKTDKNKVDKWFVSDSHYGHTNIIKYANRPFANVTEMNEKLIANWNSKVKAEDVVYFVGDFAFMDEAGIKEVLGRLNGYKILIRGNHDRSKEIMLRAGFNEVHEKMVLEFKKHQVLVNHYPYQPKDPEVAKLVKKLNRRPVDKGQWLIHGHVHQYFLQKGRQINVSVEVWDYTPVHWDQIQALIDSGPNNIGLSNLSPSEGY